MKLFVDDTRAFPSDFDYCCRDFKTATELMRKHKFEHISLDYSLGEDSKDGLQLLMWMRSNGITAPSINIHSNHIIGRERMFDYCEEHFPYSRVTKNELKK